MMFNRLFNLVVSLVMTIVLTLSTVVYPVSANPLTANQHIYTDLVAINSAVEQYQIDKYLIDALRLAHDSTEEFAVAELNDWVDNLIEKVDENFLDWYFSYWNQKKQEFGMPFAWLAFKTDSYFKLLRKEDEKNLNASEILQKRTIEDFQNKFTELVLNNQQAQADLLKLIERVGRNYASALGMKLANIKYSYNIPDVEWERYLNDLSILVYDTGNSRNSLEIESLISNLGNKLFIVSAGVGSKLAANFAVKSAAKIIGEASGAIAAKVGAQLIDPVLGVGILIWDIWDYNNMVKKSRPVLRQNILDYLEEVKWSILSSPESSIMATIEEVESKIINRLESRRVLN